MFEASSGDIQVQAMQCGHHTCEGVDEQAHKGTRAVICAPLPQQQGSASEG